MNRIFIVAREVISPWSALISAPGAGKKKFRTFSKGGRPEYEPCHGTSHALQMPMACGRFSVRALRRFTILSPFEIEEVREHVFALEVAARPLVVCAVPTAPLGRPASESGTLGHVDGAQGRGDRLRRSFMLPILSP